MTLKTFLSLFVLLTSLSYILFDSFFSGVYPTAMPAMPEMLLECPGALTEVESISANSISNLTSSNQIDQVDRRLEGLLLFFGSAIIWTGYVWIYGITATAMAADTSSNGTSILSSTSEKLILESSEEILVSDVLDPKISATEESIFPLEIDLFSENAAVSFSSEVMSPIVETQIVQNNLFISSISNDNLVSSTENIVLSDTSESIIDLEVIFTNIFNDKFLFFINQKISKLFASDNLNLTEEYPSAHINSMLNILYPNFYRNIEEFNAIFLSVGNGYISEILTLQPPVPATEINHSVDWVCYAFFEPAWNDIFLLLNTTIIERSDSYQSIVKLVLPYLG